LGEPTSQFHADVHFYGGMLAFNHGLCVYDAADTGAIGHCFTPRSLGGLPDHEKGHEVQVSILGDAGTLGVIGGDFLARVLSLHFETLDESPGYWTLEPWAEDYAATSRGKKYSAAFLPPPIVK
jgi:hypothetical protein